MAGNGGRQEEVVVVACQVAEIRGNPVWQSKNCLRCLPSMRAKWIREASPNQGCSFLNAVEKGGSSLSRLNAALKKQYIFKTRRGVNGCLNNLPGIALLGQGGFPKNG